MDSQNLAELSMFIPFYFAELNNNIEVLQSFEYIPDDKKGLKHYLVLSESLYKMQKYEKSLQICVGCINDGFEIPEIYILKGKNLFSLGEYMSAQKSFERAYSIVESNEAKAYIQKCKALLATKSSHSSEDFSRIIKYKKPV